MILQKINPNQISLGWSYVKYLSSTENKKQLTGLAVNPVTYVFELNVDFYLFIKYLTVQWAIKSIIYG